MSPARLGVQSTVENQRVRIKCRRCGRWLLRMCGLSVARISVTRLDDPSHYSVNSHRMFAACEAPVWPTSRRAYLCSRSRCDHNSARARQLPQLEVRGCNRSEVATRGVTTD